MFAPVLRHWDVLDTIGDFGTFDRLPRVRARRGALAARPSVCTTAAPAFPALLRDFVAAQGGHLDALGRAARGKTLAAA